MTTYTPPAEAVEAAARAEQERHALANDGCVPGAAYRDLAAAHADLRAGIEALAAEFEKPCPSTLAYRSEVVRAVRALLAGSGERPGACGHPNHGASGHDCRPFRPAPVVPDSADVLAEREHIAPDGTRHDGQVAQCDDCAVYRPDVRYWKDRALRMEKAPQRTVTPDSPFEPA